MEEHNIFDLERKKILERLKTAEDKFKHQSDGIKDMLSSGGSNLPTLINNNMSSFGMSNLLSEVGTKPKIITKLVGRTPKKSDWTYILLVIGVSIVAEVVVSDKFSFKSVFKRIFKWL
ncbi:MAG: hypothetical protein R2774_11305 [Saprospiraceae bacterium]